MGIRQALRLTNSYQAALDQADRITAGVGVGDPSTFPIASPWSESALAMVAADVFPGMDPDALPVTRSMAMRIPAVARARNLMVSTICRIPLEAASGSVDGVTPGPRLTPQPGWLTSSADGSSPQLRLAWTADDLLFSGWSLWTWLGGIGGDPSRVNQESWKFSDDGAGVEVKRGREWVGLDPEEYTLIPGLHEGILTYGAQTIRDARNLYDIVRVRLDSPIPGLHLHQKGGKPLTREQWDEQCGVWDAARRKRRGGTGWSTEDIEVIEMTGVGNDLLIEERNAASLDLARMVGVSAGLIDATVPKASLNYETATGRNLEFVDRDLYLYLTPIAARLSLDDVTAPGTLVRWNLTDYTAPAASPTGPAETD